MYVEQFILMFYPDCLFHINQDMFASVYPQQKTLYLGYIKFFVGLGHYNT